MQTFTKIHAQDTHQTWLVVEKIIIRQIGFEQALSHESHRLGKHFYLNPHDEAAFIERYATRFGLPQIEQKCDETASAIELFPTATRH